MRPLLSLAVLSLTLGSAPALAEVEAGSAAPQASVEEILRHLETFMPAQDAVSPALYVLGPEPRSSVVEPVVQVERDRTTAPEHSQDEQVEDEDGLGETSAPDQDATEIGEVVDPAAQALEDRLGAIDFETLSRDVQILPMIGKDMAEIDAGFRAAALHDMARRAMDSQQPAAFRKIMAAYVDSNWHSLTDAETALNIIAWMPDTAAFLGARLSAARFVGEHRAVSTEDQAFLWKDLRARVIRVGRDDYMQQMLLGMIETGFIDLAIETVKRSTASDHERMAAYLRLIEADGATMRPAALEALAAEVDALRSDLHATRYDPNVIALAYWRSGLTERAAEALNEETDPALRLRTHFEMLLSSE